MTWAPAGAPVAAGRLLVVFCLLLAGCGTNLTRLLRDDGRLYWQAEPILRVAEDLEIGLEVPAYQAEAVQRRACRVVYGGLAGRAFGGRRTSFLAALWSSLKQVFVFLVPIGPVQDCARAQTKYRKKINALCRTLQNMKLQVDCPG